MKYLSWVCYTVCIVCIALGSFMSIMLIWLGLDNVIAWKGLGTLSVFFCASLVTLGVHAIFFSAMGHSKAKCRGDELPTVRPVGRKAELAGINRWEE
jgi:hypothetical protein